MGLYDRQIATAKRLIAAKGQAVTWRQSPNGAAVDASKPWKPGAAGNQDYPVSIVFLPPGGSAQFIALMKDTEVPEGTVQGLMGAVSFTPSSKDSVIRNGVALEIVSIDELAPNGDVILYTVVFKK